MVKILACNVQKDYNFGGPSILYGLDVLMKQLYQDDYEIINLQCGIKEAAADDGLPFQTIYYYPPSRRHLFRFLFGDKKQKGFLWLCRFIRQFDVVTDLYGICFCDNLVNIKKRTGKYRWMNFASFTIPVIAKRIAGKTVVKNAASYGPVKSDYNCISADYMCNIIYDRIAAREKESKEALIQAVKVSKHIYLSPDIANLMPYTVKKQDKKKVAVSVSHMIIKQWQSEESYLICISKLCQHIISNYGLEIVLIPNESQPGMYNDCSVAKEIENYLLEQNCHVKTLDAARVCSMEIKNEIASSAVLIASRYHSCVAALSSGVPVIVAGWHYKYSELLELYGQGRWHVSQSSCTSFKLIKMFDELWNAREEMRNIISAKKTEIVRQIVNAGKELYAK